MPKTHTLSLVIACYNEEKTLKRCVEKVLEISDEFLSLEIIIVDDCSSDRSLAIAQQLARLNRNIKVLNHCRNSGKGAALRTGFQQATGDYVAIQDADLEYDPHDLKKLLIPLQQGKADVVLGSRFLTTEAHRVFHFWHALGNRFLTLLSNMFTDLNLTDMETCYKVFRREVITAIKLEENRFGFEPEIVAKIAQQRLRIYEMGISYYGRSYGEGKKIGYKDGIRAIYCILKYNLHRAPLAIQFLFYTIIGGLAALANLAFFLAFYHAGFGVNISAPLAFTAAALINYLLCVKLVFRHKARWNSAIEIIMFALVVISVGTYDWWLTRFMINLGSAPAIAKIIATASGLILNYLGRRFLVFPERGSKAW